MVENGLLAVASGAHEKFVIIMLLYNQQTHTAERRNWKWQAD